MNWSPLNLTVRVGCHLIYETTVQTPVLFVLRPRLEGRVLVMQEKLSFGIGLPSYEFQDTHGNITYRSLFMPGRNEVWHDALVAVSSEPDNRDVPNWLMPVSQLPPEVLRRVERIARSNPVFDVAFSSHGGHVGFVAGANPARPDYYTEDRAMDFFADHLSAPATP